MFVFRNESVRLGVKGSFDKESFGIVSFASVGGKYCRIEFFVFFFIGFIVIIIICS